jgi:hypothetical protein
VSAGAHVMVQGPSPQMTVIPAQAVSPVQSTAQAPVVGQWITAELHASSPEHSKLQGSPSSQEKSA